MHQPFDLERPQIFTKFDRVTQVGEGRVSMESDTHHPKGRGPASPNFYISPNFDKVWPSEQICHDNTCVA